MAKLPRQHVLHRAEEWPTLNIWGHFIHHVHRLTTVTLFHFLGAYVHDRTNISFSLTEFRLPPQRSESSPRLPEQDEQTGP